MRFFKYTLIFLTLFSSCISKKRLVDTSVTLKKMSAKKVVKKHFATNFDEKSIEAKLKANFNNGKINQSISVNLKMKTDTVIYLKGTKFITVFKLKITPTTLSYYSPYAKNYFEGDFTMLQKLLGTDINFQQLQNLLLGQSLQNIKEEKQVLEIKEKSYLLSPENQSVLFNIFFNVNPTHFKLDQQSVINEVKNQRLDIEYSSYTLIEGIYFPKEMAIKAKQNNTFTNIDFTLKSVEFNTDFEIPFSIPKGYKELKLK